MGANGLEAAKKTFNFEMLKIFNHAIYKRWTRLVFVVTSDRRVVQL
jgi:hypothetical protein